MRYQNKEINEMNFVMNVMKILLTINDIVFIRLFSSLFLRLGKLLRIKENDPLKDSDT